MISRLHFGGPGSDQSTLYDAMNFWTRKKISKSKADFYALEQLIIHSFQARVCALLWCSLAQSRPEIGLEFEDVARILAAHDAEAFSRLLDKIVHSYDKNARSTDDLELRNHVLFLQHTQTYLLLKYSIKHADLGLLRRAIDRCCVYFHGSGQFKYAYEMLYLQRLISTRAATPELQRAILANGLVNRQGKADSWYETDRLVEFHNGTLRKLLNAKRGSALTMDYLFEHCALNTEFFDSTEAAIMSSFFSSACSTVYRISGSMAASMSGGTTPNPPSASNSIFKTSGQIDTYGYGPGNAAEHSQSVLDLSQALLQIPHDIAASAIFSALKEQWLMDSGSARTICSDIRMFGDDFRSIENSIKLATTAHPSATAELEAAIP